MFNTDTYLSQISRKFKPLAKSALLGRQYAKIIKLKCLDCCLYEIDNVRFCTTYNCPIWRVRPYQKEIGEQTCH